MDCAKQSRPSTSVSCETHGDEHVSVILEVKYQITKQKYKNLIMKSILKICLSNRKITREGKVGKHLESFSAITNNLNVCITKYIMKIDDYFPYVYPSWKISPVSNADILNVWS